MFDKIELVEWMDAGWIDRQGPDYQPAGYFRIVSEEDRSPGLAKGRSIQFSRDGLEDPDAEILIVHRRLNEELNDRHSDDQWVVEYRGRLWIAKWLVKLMGYKGISVLDTGYFYCPYIPLMQTPVVLDPASFSKAKGIVSRYGKKLLKQAKKFYGKVEIDGQ